MKQTVKILHLEDESNDAELARAALSDAGITCDVSIAGNHEEFTAALDRGGFDLVIADYNLPGFDGLTALAMTRAKHPDCPFIFLSGTMGEDVAIDSLKNGATDYVLKHRISRLAPAVQRALKELEERVALNQAEKALRESEARYRALFNNSIDAILLTVPDGRILAANHEACRIFGRSEEEICRIGRDGLVDTTDPRLNAALQERSRTGNFKGELAFRRKDGSSFPGEISSALFKGPDDSEMTSMIIRDITERKLAEELLAKLSQAVEQSPVSIVITNVKGEIEYVNPKFTQITGYSREEALGQNPSVLKSGETSPEDYQQLWAMISSGNTWQGEFHNRRKDGELFWEAATISPIKSKAGDITNFIAVKEDITERKSLERQVRQALKMEAISTLAGGIAHDFNNLMTAIIGFGTLLEMRMSPDDPLRKFASNILSAADRAASLTKSLLTFSREQPLDTKVVDLNHVIRNIVTLLPQVVREDIECRLLLSEEELPIFADQGQLDQIVLNLATNSRDAMPNGGVLSISTMAMEMDQQFINAHGYGTIGNYAVLTVSDTGAGMDPAIRQRVFEPFFTTKEVGKGTGLGLAIIFGIVKQHHGYISCYSEPGIGTRFNIYLPLYQGKTEQNIMLDTPLPVGGTETILLAEDEDMVRNLVSTILKGAGYRVIEAVNGSDAVQQYMDHRNDVELLILDLVMPKKNGRDVYNAIREVTPQIRVIFTSGYSADIVMIPELIGEGFDFISKPVRPADLLKKVREVLDRST